MIKVSVIMVVFNTVIMVTVMVDMLVVTVMIMKQVVTVIMVEGVKVGVVGPCRVWEVFFHGQRSVGVG